MFENLFTPLFNLYWDNCVQEWEEFYQLINQSQEFKEFCEKFQGIQYPVYNLLSPLELRQLKKLTTGIKGEIWELGCGNMALANELKNPKQIYRGFDLISQDYLFSDLTQDEYYFRQVNLDRYNFQPLSAPECILVVDSLYGPISFKKLFSRMKAIGFRQMIVMKNQIAGMASKDFEKYLFKSFPQTVKTDLSQDFFQFILQLNQSWERHFSNLPLKSDQKLYRVRHKEFQSLLQLIQKKSISRSLYIVDNEVGVSR